MLFRKMMRDIGKNKVQFLAVFLMMFLGCFLFSGITGEWQGFRIHAQKFRDGQNFADGWIFGEFSSEDLEKVKAQKEILQAQGRLLLQAYPQNQEKAVLDCYFTQEDTISTLLVRQGVPYNGQEEGIWLDDSFARENGYQLGDSLTLTYSGGKITGEILGLVYSPEYIYGASQGEMVPDHKAKGFAYVSPRLLPSGEQTAYDQIAVKTQEEELGFLKGLFPGQKVEILNGKDHPSVSMIKDEYEQHRTIGTIFSAAFLLIAMMISITTLHRMLKNQRMQIGILKALGFGKRKLIVHYISHSTLVCLAGAGLGYIAGYRIMPDLIYGFLKEMYVLPVWEGMLPREYVFLPLGCTFLCMVISLGICKNYLKGTAADSMSPEEYHLSDANGMAERIPCTLSFASRWNLRDISRNKLRSFMTLCGILGCTALLFSAFVLYDTFTGLSAWTFQEQQAYECKIANLPNEEGCRELMKLTDGELLMEGEAVIQTEDGREHGVTLTVPQTSRYFRLAKSLREFTEISGGIALSQKTARELGVREGDWITWHEAMEQKQVVSQVKAIVRTPLSQGIIIMKADYENTGQTYLPTAIVGQRPQEGFGIYEDQCTISYQKDLTKSVDSVMDGMIMMIALLVSGAVILGSVMLYNLGILSYLERYREFATLKVLGFGDKKIRKILVQQNVWLSAVGIAAGIPGGFALIYFMLRTLPDSMDVPLRVNGFSWAVTVLGTLMLSWLISTVVSRKIARIQMVEALKAKE